MLIVAERLVLYEYEPDLGAISQPCEQVVPATDLPGCLRRDHIDSDARQVV
ncbi:MAG: hypothetical protein M3Y88_00495 [Chloroflexota bacterium]|nr:hypothetical protein [Chloroflexota bacterium]